MMRISLLAVAAALALAGPALAQTPAAFVGTSTNPNAPPLGAAALNGAFATKQDFSKRGAANGYAPLDGAARVPLANLPVPTGLATTKLPDDFRLTSDADDFESFGRWIAYIRANNLSGGQLRAGKRYLVRAQLDFTNLHGFDLDMAGATIAAPAGDIYAVIDALGTGQSRFHNGTLTCGSQAHPCNFGLQIGRSNMDQGQEQNTVSDLTIDGYFARAARFNNGELFNEERPRYNNHYVAPGCSVGNPDVCGYAAIQDGVNHWALASSYVTPALVLETFVSFNENTITSPVYYNTGNGPALWMAGTHRHRYTGGGYIQVQGAGTTPSVVMYSTASAGEGQFHHDLIWDVHSEIRPSAIFHMVGNANPAFFGLTMLDHLVQADHLFTTASGVATVRIYGANLRFTSFLNTTASLFDAPGKFQINGDLFMFQENAALWNGPVFSGAIHTNARTNFLAAATFGAGGFTIDDPFGQLSRNVPVAGSLSIAGGRVIAGSDTANPNVNLDDGLHAGSQPHLDFNGWGTAGSGRVINDAAGRLSFLTNGNVQLQLIDGSPVYLQNGLTTQQTVSANALKSAAPYTYVTLPAPTVTTAMVYCLDCLKPGEAAGSGTGMWVFADGYSRWVSTAGTLAAH